MVLKMHIDLTLLTSGQAKDYVHFATWREISLLESRQKNLLFLGIQESGIPSGLAILALNSLNGYADVSFLNVGNHLQRTDVYTKVLESLAIRAKKKGLRLLTMCSPPFAPLDEAMNLCHWSEPHPWLLRLHFDCYTFNPTWFTRRHALPPKFSFISLADLTVEQERQIEHHLDQYNVKCYLSPLNDRNHLQPINSLGLAENGQIIGWMATHTFPDTPNSINYSSLYISPEFHHSGYAIVLLAEAIRLQQASSLRESSLELRNTEIQPGWMKFVKNRLIPYSSKQVQSFRREYFF